MNLALLRVFGILIAVHELNRLVRLLLQVTMSGSCCKGWPTTL